MDKRKVIHELIDRLLDVEETSKKRVSIYYHGFCESFSFSICRNKLAIHDDLLKARAIYFSNPILNDLNIDEILAQINEVSLIEDVPEEKQVDIKISESKARELGLIA
jgi:hypothetical protein